MKVYTLYEDMKPEMLCKYYRHKPLRYFSPADNPFFWSSEVKKTRPCVDLHQRFPKDDSSDPKFLFFK